MYWKYSLNTRIFSKSLRCNSVSLNKPIYDFWNNHNISFHNYCVCYRPIFLKRYVRGAKCKPVQLCHKIQFCRQNWILSRQNSILSTEFNSVYLKFNSVDRIEFCLVKFTSVSWLVMYNLCEMTLFICL